MNYRHIYHAGNFADVMKHLTLALCIDYLKKKETPFCVIDAHGGLGFYNLQSVEAEKTNEWKDGIGRFQDATSDNDDFNVYFNIVKHDLNQGFYCGSPALTSKLLRPQDRLIVNELHPEDFETLSHNMRCFKNVRPSNLDAYECIRANIPPKEKRGIVLIDPPFEKKDEFETLIRQMEEWKKRFEKGVFVLWYPIKEHLNVEGLKLAAKNLGLSRTWCFETLLYPRVQKGTFNGSGLIVFNTPFTVPERIQDLCPFLKERMGLLETSCTWLTPA